jgi:hypothetical protein
MESGYHSCSFCYILGKGVKRDKKHYIFFVGGCEEKRTHKLTTDCTTSDVNMADMSGSVWKGVKGKSVVASLEYLDMIYSFDLDYMHAFCCNTGPRLLNIWFSKKFSEHPASLFQQLKHLEKLYGQFKMPHCIHRLPKTFAGYEHWKAAEVRYTLLLSLYLNFFIKGLLPYYSKGIVLQHYGKEVL